MFSLDVRQLWGMGRSCLSVIKRLVFVCCLYKAAWANGFIVLEIGCGNWPVALSVASSPLSLSLLLPRGYNAATVIPS